MQTDAAATEVRGKMTQAPQLYNSFAPLGNVVAMVELVMRLQDRTPGLPGMACYYGRSGLGKTTAAIFTGHKFRAHHIELRSRWTPRHFCEQLMAELGLDLGRRMTVSRMIDAVSDQLGRTGRPLLIDEADYLLRHDMVEIARDIYEGSGTPVVLIGEELLPKKLEQYERVHGRMLDWVGAQPGTLDDVGHLASLYAPGIEIAPDLREAILAASHNSIRRICNNLDEVRKVAAVEGHARMDLATWGDRPFAQVGAPHGRSYTV